MPSRDKTRWVFNPKSYEEGTTSMTGTFRQRGVAYWIDGEDDERVFWGTGNGYLVCVDAHSGIACPDFGEDGAVDAMVGLPRAAREDRDYLNAMLYSIHSPPIVVRNKVIHGSQITDRRITKEAIPGWVRAWDVRTGEHAWDFHTVPASSRRVWGRHLAQRVVALLRECQRVVDACRPAPEGFLGHLSARSRARRRRVEMGKPDQGSAAGGMTGDAADPGRGGRLVDA